MSEMRCARCGADPASGYAMIGDERFCHGDDIDPSDLGSVIFGRLTSTCYERSQWERSGQQTDTIQLAPHGPLALPVAPDPENASKDVRTLRFTLEIETELGAGDDAAPSARYVGDWLNDNGYGYRQIGELEATTAPVVDVPWTALTETLGHVTSRYLHKDDDE